MKERQESAPDAEVASGDVSARMTVLLLATCMLIASLGVSIANVALPSLTHHFDAPFRSVQWVVVSYLISMTVLSAGMGRLGDLYGHRKILLFGIAGFTLATLAAALAPRLDILILARALQGAAGAALMVLPVAMIRETVPANRIGRAMGLFGTMSAIGTALGPALGGFLIEAFGWRSIFIVLVPASAALAALTAIALPVSRMRRQARRFDIGGTLLLGAALVAYALTTTIGGAFPVKAVALALASVALTVLFVRHEARTEKPLIHLSMLRDRVLQTSLVVNILVTSMMMATLVIGPFFLARGLGLDEAAVGLVMSTGPLIAALSGVPAGRLVDRFGAWRMTLGGLALMGMAAFSLALLPAFLGLAGYLFSIAFLTPGFQLFQAANNTGVMNHMSADQRGIGSGLLGLSRNLGFLTGASVMGAIFALAAGTGDMAAAAPDAVTNGLRVSFILAGVSMFAALGFASLRR